MIPATLARTATPTKQTLWTHLPRLMTTLGPLIHLDEVASRSMRLFADPSAPAMTRIETTSNSATDFLLERYVQIWVTQCRTDHLPTASATHPRWPRTHV